jgi:hypothetical protein
MGDNAYKEYIDANDLSTVVKLSNVIQNAIKGTRGRTYKVQQSSDLYPTAGVSTDFAFARHQIAAAKAKVQSFTIEWGNPNNMTPFHPSYPEMQKIIQEVTAGLLAFCLAAS